MPEEKQIDWSKAPEGATHYLPETGHYHACWVKEGYSMRVGTQNAWLPDEVDSVLHLLIPRPVAWNGEGLPPVGIVCEFLRYDRDEEEHTYSECKVLAHDDDGSAVFRVTSGPCIGSLVAKYAGDFDDGLPMFRPIRTAEQIAAEEREKALEAMFKIYRDAGEFRAGLSALYDAGCRLPKVEA